MDRNASVIRYSLLGWGQWVYGPFFTLAGLFLVYLWQREIFHTVANSGVVVHSIADWFSAAICPGSRCETWEYAFSTVMWFLFLGTGFFMFGVGVLMMNVDRYTIVQNRSLITWRGNFFHWQKQTLTAVDIASIEVEKAPVFGLIGNRAYKVGDKWRVTAILNKKGIFRKPKKCILALEWQEADARAIAARCAV